MRKKKMLIVLLIIAYSLIAKKLTTFSDLLRPQSIIISNNQAFIAEGPSIYIYSMKNFKIIKKIGKKGEGPREFKLYQFLDKGISIALSNNKIFAGSEKKVSTFSIDGEFIKEKRLNDSTAFNWMPLSEKLVGMKYKTKETGPYFSFHIFDTSGKELKELCQQPIPHYKQKDLVLWSKLSYASIANFQTLPDRILVASGKEFEINIFDGNGILINAIKMKYKRVKITADDESKIQATWQEKPYIKERWPVFKKIIKIPKYFPAIKTFLTTDNKIFVQTYKKREKNSEFFIFDRDGNFLKKKMQPIAFKNIIDIFPYTIHKGKIYQLVENEETDRWELHESEIKKP